MRTAFSSAVPNHRRLGAVTRRNEVDRVCRSDSGGTVGSFFVSPRLFSSQEESSRFLFSSRLLPKGNIPLGIFKFINDQKWRSFL